MKNKIAILIAGLASSITFAQIEGNWKGALQIQGNELPLIFHVEKKGTEFSSNFDSPKQGARGIPVKTTTFENNEVTFDASNLGIVYKGTFKNEEITGQFSQNGMQFPMNLKKVDADDTGIKRPQTPKPPFDYPTEEVTFINPKDKNTLAGTLTLPKDKKNFPIVILITGSGQQNRNEELFSHQPFAVIADDFAKKGIATLRLDDRGIDGSSVGTPNDTSENFASDINTAVDFLVKKGYKNIGLIGHSEGGMIAPMVANQNKNVKFIVSMAGVGIPVLDLMMLQNQKIAELTGAPKKQIDDDLAIKKHYFTFLSQYKGSDFEKEAQKEMASFFEKNKDISMPKEVQENLVSALIKQTNNAWFKYFIQFNPNFYLKNIKIPFLALNGSLDSQVTAKENLEGFKNSLAKAGNKKAEIVELPGLNHLFQTAKTGSPQEYGEIEETISPKVLDKMSSWILGLK